MIDISLLFYLGPLSLLVVCRGCDHVLPVGLLVGYVLSVTLVFKYRRLNDKRIEFASFAGIGKVVGLAINAPSYPFGVKILGVHYLIGKCGRPALPLLGILRHAASYFSSNATGLEYRPHDPIRLKDRAAEIHM